MSFDNPSPYAHWQSSLASSSSDKQAQPRQDRPSPFAWGQQPGQAFARRGLAPLATTNLFNTSATGTRRQTQANDSESYNPATSPSNANFPPLAATSVGRFSSRRPTPPGSSHSNSPITNLQSGANQQQSYHSARSITSPRSRTITPSQQINGAAGLFSHTAPGGGGGSGSLTTSARSGAYSPSLAAPGIGSPTGFNFERSASISSNPSSATTGQSSFSKISATQVLLLLDTISEKEGRAKWEAKAEKIRKLLESNGMEVFAPFFRRVVTSNAAAIFSGARDFDQGSYKLLQQELDKVIQDPEQPAKIAETIDTSKEDVFRDFDLNTFIRHFFSDPLPQVLLANAFARCNRADLHNKAEKFLAEATVPCLRAMVDGRAPLQNLAPRNVAAIIEYLCFSPVLATPEQKYEVFWAIGTRYDSQNLDVPADVMSALQLLRLPENHQDVAQFLQKNGPKSISTKQAVTDLLQSVEPESIEEADIANAILFIILSRSLRYDLNIFVNTVKSHASRKNWAWENIIQGFDISGLRIQTEDFVRLFDALRPIAIEESQFDIQKLWGGKWQNPQTQISFLRGLLTASSRDVGPSKIPNFRAAFSISDFGGFSTENKKSLEALLESQFASAEAMGAIFETLLGPEIPPDDRDRMDILAEVYQNHPVTFLLSLSRTKTKPWNADQEKYVQECFRQFLEQRRPDYSLLFACLSAKDPEFIFELCTVVFQHDPRQTETIFERAEEFGWTEDFLKHWSNPLALDIACMRAKLSTDFDLDKYLSDIAEGHANLGVILCKYVRIKADDEFRVQREHTSPQSIPLSLPTVYTLLQKLEDLTDDRELVQQAQTTCLQTYPRLMNYDAGFDDILIKSSEEKGNKLPEEIDKQMSELFGRMYRSELSIRDMVNEMRVLKTSRDPDQQDLFCCIVHGLFDEYVCYSEYPEDALEKTALLFGNIIKYKLLPKIPSEFGLALIYRAVQEHPPDSLMHRFGIEALLQISDQLSEWPGLCALLLNVSSLQHPEILQRAREGLQNQQLEQANGSRNLSGTNGDSDDFLRQESPARGFRAIHADAPPTNARFKDPEQNVQEKILFVINNLSKDNMTAKLADMKESFSQEHSQWFAAYLVEQRARVEPNNQEMYYQFVTMIDDKSLTSEILRETYISVVKLMNAESTISSATERSHLKNLGGWLGSITLAQDKPIKHVNISFIDLLLEGYDTQRLVVVIPFTCKVLAQGARSMVFQPPNPWLMEIVRLLKELYLFADLKLNLKFEIEVLYKDLDISFKSVEESIILRNRPLAEDDTTIASGLPDGMENFDNLSLNGAMNRGVRERLSAAEIMASLPSLEEVLKYPPTSGSPADQALVKSIIYRAFDQAIQEIIAPVVERSITIASISTAQLISKDYALESDAERYRQAARQMVKSLAGSLALVTCKEPLRMSITNYIRRPAQDDLPEHVLPEGAILMCVNDNLDTACSFVEQAAEERAIPEIDLVIESELEERRRYAAEAGGRDFMSSSSNVNRWSTWIPEPFRQNVGGLNESQRAVYEDFDRRVHGMNINHVQNASTDSTGRQIPDVLQETLAMPNLSTPADQPALPHQSPMAQQEPRMLSAMSQPRINGFADNISPHERIAILIEDVQKAAKVSDAGRLKDLERNSTIFQDFRQILIVLTSSTRPTADLLARQIAEKLCNIFVSKPPQDSLEAEVLAFLLSKLCQLSELIIRDVLRWMTANEHLLMASSNVVAALVIVGLMDFSRVDAAIAMMLSNRELHGLQLLSDLMDQTLFTDEPLALRADFAHSLLTMCAWLKDEPSLQLAVDINQKLRAHGMPEFVSIAVSDKTKAKHDQMRYIFDEWVGIFENLSPTEGTSAAFLREMHKGQIINSTEDLADFLRLCIDSCIECFEREAQSIRGSIDSAFLQTDSLARLVIMLVAFQGETNGAVQISKAPYLATILSVIVLIMNHHQVMHGVAFHQRVFHRLLSAILYEYSSSRLEATPDHHDMILAFETTMRSLQPAWFPGFTFAWMNLITHRVLVSGLMGLKNDTGSRAYRDLTGLSLLYLAESLRIPNMESVVVDLYRGILRNILVLHHDFPELLCVNYTYLCSRIPYQIPQLRNLILTSRPAAYQDLPDPMTPGLKVERLEEMKQNPDIASDFDVPLDQENLKESIDLALSKNSDVNACIKQIKATFEPENKSSAVAPSKSIEILNSIVPYVGQDACANGSRFDPHGQHVAFLTKLAIGLDPSGRYYLMNGFADQIRYPNTQTDYFCKLLLHLWGATNSNEQQRELREPISRVIYERLAVARPHPWGITILSMELQQNSAYGFWDVVAAEGTMHQRLQQAMRASH